MSIKKEVLKYLRENKDYFYRRYGIKSIKLFGSVARGEDNENSDIDLLVEFDYTKKIGMIDYMKFIKEIERRFNRKSDVATWEMIRPIIKKYVKKDIINAY